MSLLLLLLSLAVCGHAAGPRAERGVPAAARGNPAAFARAVPAAVIPGVPGQVPGLGAPLPAAAAPAQAVDTAGAQLQTFAAGLDAPAGSSDPGALSTQRFDGARPDMAGGSAEEPKVPSGVLRVSVDVVRTERDVVRLIPSGANSNSLIAKLRLDVGRMAPYRVFTYHDARGGRFTGIDLSQKPELIENFPEQHSHEIKLVKKIQLWNKDLQLVVREDGVTPDLVLGGVVTELKSLIGKQITLTKLIDKANNQVREHAKRHGLGHGSVVVDLAELKQVPVDRVLADLEKWRAGTGDVVLDKIFVFAGAELKLFARGPDGSYRAETPSSMPLVPRTGPAAPRDVHVVQLLVKKGRLLDAERALNRLHPPIDDAHHPLAQARFAMETERLMSRLSKFVRLQRLDDAWRAWQGFKNAYGAAAHILEPRVRDILPIVDVVKTPLELAGEPEKVLREMEEPALRLQKAGVEAVITVYGSARLKPGSRYYEEARRFGALVAQFGGGRVAVVTGGGPGIMEAANRGAFEAGGPSVGYNIHLAHEQQPNPYVTAGLSYDFEYFSTRKMNLRRGAMGLVYFPGGFGTLDEFFEVVTLIQTGKMPRLPIVLVGKREHWDELIDFEHLVRRKLISPEDLSLFKFVETAEQAWSVVAAAQRSLAK